MGLKHGTTPYCCFYPPARNKEKIIEKFEKQINLDENEANKLYEIVMRIIGTEIKNKLKHPFKSQD